MKPQATPNHSHRFSTLSYLLWICLILSCLLYSCASPEPEALDLVAPAPGEPEQKTDHLINKSPQEFYQFNNGMILLTDTGASFQGE